MVDIHSMAQSLTIHLPADLIVQLQRLAQEKNLSIDEVVREACLAYTEPYIWERYYQDAVGCQLGKPTYDPDLQRR